MLACCTLVLLRCVFFGGGDNHGDTTAFIYRFRDDLEVLSKASKKAHALAEDVIEKKEAAAKAKKKAKKEAKKKGIEVPNESEEYADLF